MTDDLADDLAEGDDEPRSPQRSPAPSLAALGLVTPADLCGLPVDVLACWAALCADRAAELVGAGPIHHPWVAWRLASVEAHRAAELGEVVASVDRAPEAAAGAARAAVAAVTYLVADGRPDVSEVGEIRWQRAVLDGLADDRAVVA